MVEPSPYDPAAKDPELTRKLLASLWERNLPVMQTRLTQLEHTVGAARAGTLTPQLRTEAAETAHKLSGSLGMFGYPQGTEFARRLEVHLEDPGPIDPFRLAEDLAAMRATLSL